MRALISVVLIAITLSLAACGSKVSPDNYAKINSDMTKEQVYAVIGKPTEVSSAGVGSLTASNETWRGKDHTITITFANDKLRFKSITSNSSAQQN